MYFTDYVWVNGRPKGLMPTTLEESLKSTVYKIVKDPYGKRISLERFQSGHFLDCAYDSHLFDFRVLSSNRESSWQKIESESINQPSSLIIDHDDRTIAKEFYHFENGLCTECRIHYPEGPLVARQRIIYHEDKTLKAMLLFDVLGSCAGIKIFDPEGNCIFESWDMSEKKAQEKFLAHTTLKR